MADEDDDAVQRGIEHLQAAAREMIQATRSLLDAAEELVDDPKAVQGVMTTLGALAHAAASRLRHGGDGDGDDADASDDGRVQRIRIS